MLRVPPCAVDHLQHLLLADRQFMAHVWIINVQYRRSEGDHLPHIEQMESNRRVISFRTLIKWNRIHGDHFLHIDVMESDPRVITFCTLIENAIGSTVPGRIYKIQSFLKVLKIIIMVLKTA
jgi:hypothetical protein